MLKNAFTGILFLIAFNGFAQKDHFISIQSEKNQPFYATINGKALTSSDAGYLMIPKLSDTVYSIGIAFPRDLFHEEKFSILINKKDHSFQLKSIPEIGWELLDTATTELIMSQIAQSALSKHSSPGPIKKEDAFSRLMAGVVNDTSVMYTSYEEEEPKKETYSLSNTKPAAIKMDIPLVFNNKTEAQDTLKKQEPILAPPVKKTESKTRQTDSTASNSATAKPPLYRPKDSTSAARKISFVKKLSEQKNDSALHMVFADISIKGGIDTVNIFIPLSHGQVAASQKKHMAKQELETAEHKESKQTKDSVAAVEINNGVENTRHENKKKDSIKADAKEITKAPVTRDCTSSATDYDIDKLRVKMLAMDNDDDKILAARNVYKIKCFSVKQVNALGEVFKTDEGKYKLFDAVYAHVSDAGNFIQLQQSLTDPYYINRFKAMIR